jgi:hypothetical protein
MISIKRYLEEPDTVPGENGKPEAQSLLPITIAAYRSSLVEMGNCGQDACPALGGELKHGLGKLGEKLSAKLTCESVKETETGVREHL